MWQPKFIASCEKIGIALSDQQVSQFEKLSEMLADWNCRINLTRVPEEDFWSLHFLDSLAILNSRLDLQSGTLIDVGTGAGFPGLPLKIAFPDLRVTMVDSTAKKLKFIDTVISELSLVGAKTVAGRAEDLSRLPAHREKYDFVCARAVAAMPVLAEWLVPFAKVGGSVIALKSAQSDEEIASGQNAAKLLGCGKINTVIYQLPVVNVERVMAISKKERSTPMQYPRHGAQILAKPL